MTTAVEIIDFISTLHGMDRLQPLDVTKERPGAYDLSTAQAMEPSPDYPEGDKLIVGRLDGQRVHVHTHILLEHLLLRTAQAYSVTQGGTVRGHYEALQEHLAHKTGFGSQR